MKIAFFIDNKDVAGVDCRNIDSYNPGLGGTHYMFFLISSLLSRRDNQLEVSLIVTAPGLFKPDMHIVVLPSMEEAWNWCDSNNISYLTVRGGASDFSARSASLHDRLHRTKLIVWCHNFLSLKELNLLDKCADVVRIINVGREQMDLYRDHPAFNKSDYIYNCVDVADIKTFVSRFNPDRQRKHTVTYMGAVIPGKGFHILAKAWPRIIKAVPDAELFVIGSGELYNKAAELGKWKLAGQDYENMFIRHITSDGALLPGIHLMGILGKEKYDILSRTKIGVPNPSGLTETFCISAVEMQMMGARIVSKKCAGYLDTVFNGVLYNRYDDLADYIIDELKKDTPRRSLSETTAFIEHNFSQTAVVGQWERLFKICLPGNSDLHDKDKLVNPGFEMKVYKDYLRKLKNRCPLLRHIVPPLEKFIGLYNTVDYFLYKKRY